LGTRPDSLRDSRGQSPDFNQITVGRFDIVPFLIAVIVAAMLLWLYPNKAQLWMSHEQLDGPQG